MRDLAFVRRSLAPIAISLCVAGSIGSAALADSAIRPDATMLQFPDVSEDSIVFVYANDIWKVPREGGTAVKIASPPGPERFPKFDPQGKTIAFMGNYEGNADIYTLPADGSGIAYRVTHHPSAELLADWTPDGKLLLAMVGFEKPGMRYMLATVDAEGGLPEPLPVPYGTRAAISADGTWLAYTPYSRDNATWKRYTGGQQTDIWLFNLVDHSAKRITDWEGTDSIPMWHGEKVYYLSDAGPNHKLNIWVYDTTTQEREQVTAFDEYDVKWPSIGPGKRGRGEIVLQNGSRIHLLDLRSRELRPVDITIPGDRPTLRDQMVDYSDYISGGDISATGKRAVIEARGEIFSVPAENGITRNLTRTNGIAERDPLWSPDGKWIAYLSDATGEYEIYITQSDGRGETRQLTDEGTCYRILQAWSPDSKTICFGDKTGAIYLLDVETQEITHVVTNAGYGTPDVNWSHDSKWLTFSLSDGVNDQGVIHVYNIENAELTAVTSPMFDSLSPTFDRKGDFLYFTSTRSFSPTYSDIDTTFVYRKSGVLLAVPLNSEVENPWFPESDEEEWDDEEADDEDADDEDADDEGDDAEDDEAESDDGDEADDEDADDDDEEDEDAEDEDAYVPTSPIHGVWEGTVSGLSAMGLPPEMDSASFTMSINVAEDGTITGTNTVEMMGESQTDDLGEITFDEATGEFTATDTEEGMTSILRGMLEGDTITGTWEVVEMGISGTFSVTKTDAEVEEDDDDEAKPVVIDIEGFERRAMLLPVDAGNFRQLACNDKNQLLYLSGGRGGLPSIKLFDIDDPDTGERNVVAGVFGYALSGDGKKLIVLGAAGAAIISAAPGQSLAKTLPTDGLRGKISPRKEWAQILRDAWRIQRDYFYDAGMHGLDWDAIYDRYSVMVDDCITREDLSFVISEMISELNVGHAYYGGGDGEGGGPRENIGMLGCDFELATTEEGTAYRIKRIYEGAAWDADARGPLSQLGVDVNVGDFILEVNGLPIDTEIDPWAAFIGMAGRVTEIAVSEKPVIDDDVRRILLEPMRSEGNLRYRAWIEANRTYVEEQTNGTVGYIYVPDTGVNGQNDLYRQFYGQKGKAGLIIDERWNGGGQLPHRFIELLNRPVMNYFALRDATDMMSPQDSHQGPKVMLINGLAGSGGDHFPKLFRQAGLGPIIGTRTWGGLVGITGNPQLIDGAFMTVPRFGYYDLDGTWGIEGHGVDPDIEVIDDPSLMVDGGDPQLERAVEVILELIEENPYVPPTRPAGPDRSGMGVPERDW
ncbi:MAG: PD40 domain-containing protein [Phycisphaerales bacterium]|nr:PD40 domain-containing protein [Phycisphaerales bacterium]